MTRQKAKPATIKPGENQDVPTPEPNPGRVEVRGKRLAGEDVAMGKN